MSYSARLYFRKHFTDGPLAGLCVHSWRDFLGSTDTEAVTHATRWAQDRRTKRDRFPVQRYRVCEPTFQTTERI